MFHGTGRQRFNLKNVQFLVLLFSMFGLQAHRSDSSEPDLDKKSSMQIIAQAAQRYRLQKLTRDYSQVDLRNNTLLKSYDDTSKQKRFLVIDRLQHFVTRKKLSQNISDVAELSCDKTRKLADAMVHLKEKFRCHLQEKFGNADDDRLPLFLTDGLSLRDQFDEKNKTEKLDDLFDQKPTMFVGAGMLTLAGLGFGATTTGTAVVGTAAVGAGIVGAAAPAGIATFAATGMTAGFGGIALSSLGTTLAVTTTIASCKICCTKLPSSCAHVYR